MHVCNVATATWFMTIQPVLCCPTLVTYSKCVSSPSAGCAVLCCAVLCCAVLCCAVLCCAVLHHDANYATLAVNYYTCAPQAAAPNSNGAPNRLQSAGSQASSIAQCCCTHLTPVAKLLSSRSCPEFNIANPNCAKQQQECANCCQAV